MTSDPAATGSLPLASHATVPPGFTLRSWRTAVFVIFAINGFGMATWISRVPAYRAALRLDTAEVGLLLLGGSAGAILGLLASSHVIAHLGGRRTLRIVLLGQALGVLVVGLGSLGGSFAGIFAGLALFGVNSSVGDVAMNVEAAETERLTGRTIMPLFHALFSVGTVAGAGVGSLMAFAGVAPLGHFAGVAVLIAVVGVLAPRFIPRQEAVAEEHAPRTTLRERLVIWLEPRTLLIGLIMLGMAFTEGSANDWLALAMIDGRGVDQGQGALLFAVFVAAMTLGRVAGGPVVDRIGRVPALRGAALLAILGLLVVILVPVVWIDVVGIVLWGIGASLGFPLGMSAAADDPVKAAARVSAVATVAYFAFLVGPPVIGFVGQGVGLLNALLVVVGLIVLSLLATPAARERRAS
ncbi:MAG: MFS transporter [Micrococcales bacterium]|nr:MFS transporter [Micrococcales bacterium]